MDRSVCAACNRFLAAAAALMIALPAQARAQALDERAASMRSPEELVRWMADEFSYTMVLPDRPRSPEEVLAAHTGDCDDMAILASSMLTRMGIGNEVLILKFRGLNVRHAICIWKDGDGAYSFISDRELTRTGKVTVEDAIRKYYPDCETVASLDVRSLCGVSAPGSSRTLPEGRRQGSRTECAPAANLDSQLYSSL